MCIQNRCRWRQVFLIVCIQCKVLLQVEYKEYTLRDYRKMKKEVKLGGLGPDLDSEDAKEKVGAFRIWNHFLTLYWTKC